MKRKISNTFIYLFLIAVLIVTVFPIIFTIFASFKTNQEILTANNTILPKSFTLDNYRQAWESDDFNVALLTWNSTYYSVITVFFQILSTAVAGYVFSRGHFTGQKTVFGIMTALMFVNLGGATTVPMLKIVKAIQLDGSLWGLIVVKAFGINIAGIYLVMSYIKTLPKEMDEAAFVDGCGFAGIFVKIIAPLLTPVLVTIAMLAFQGSWNETVMPMIFTLSKPMQKTLSAGLYALKNTGESASQWNLMMAGSVISMMPVLILYAFANRFFVSGLANGAVKG